MSDTYPRRRHALRELLRAEDLDAIFESGGDGRGEWLPVGASGPPGMRILIHCAQDRGTLPPSGGPRIWCS